MSPLPFHGVKLLSSSGQESMSICASCSSSEGTLPGAKRQGPEPAQGQKPASMAPGTLALDRAVYEAVVL